jgi:hypothetical protein
MEKSGNPVASVNKSAYVSFIRAATSGLGRIVRTQPWSFA